MFRERDNLKMLSTKENQKPFIVTLYATFQDEESLYFVLSYAPHRDIGEKMRNKVFDIELTRFLVAEICLALGKASGKGIFYSIYILRLHSFERNIAQRCKAGEYFST